MRVKYIPLLLLVLISSCLTDKKQREAKNPVKSPINLTGYVNPFIGTGGHGHTYPGATVPFGMVQLSPDTRLTGWDGCSGYHYTDSVIYGFSHTHLSGTGVPDYNDILLMPSDGEVYLNNGIKSGYEKGYGSLFRKENESASPGYYKVLLDDHNIEVELTASKRVGFHKYKFNGAQSPHIIVDLTHRDEVIESGIRIINDTTIEGFRRSKAWAEDQHVYFHAVFSKPFKSSVAKNDVLNKSLTEAEGKNIKAVLFFDRSEEVLVKVGISAVSMEGAKKNLRNEAPHFSFEKTRTEAEHAWNIALNKIKVSGGTEDQKINFYSALYHTMLCPNLFMDVDGKYRGTDLKVHTAKDFTNYTIFSLWDTYRATHPLYTLIEQERTVDFIRTFLRQYEHGGQLPVWELAANYTGCMIGYHSVPVIVDAFLKGIDDFDHEKALEAMLHSASQDHLGLKEYREYGYIPSDKEHESVSKTLEYAYDDWCIAMMAKSMGKEKIFNEYIERAQYYKNLYDPATGFMRAKRNGSWWEPFDPAEVNFNYTEANSWQYSFYVPQDIEGKISIMGGKEKFEARLDSLFTVESQTTGRHQVDITGLIGQYAHGNEPSHHMAYLYSFTGKPRKTEKMVRRIMEEMYSPAPDGLSGNEDCGQMSAWYVFSAMGFYPVTPGAGYYVLGSPVFDEVTIALENGKAFVIRANNNSGKNLHIASAELNGRSWENCWLNHADIITGGELVLNMTDEPGDFGTTPPESSINDNLIVPAPFIDGQTGPFREEAIVRLKVPFGDYDIHYTLDGTEPDNQSSVYNRPLTINQTCTLKFFATDGTKSSKVIESTFFRFDNNTSIDLKTEYSSQYTAGGDYALIDRIRGGDDFRTGAWQGYYGNDLKAVIAFDESRQVNRVVVGFLQDINSWIFMPEYVELYGSADESDFALIGRANTKTSHEEWGVILEDFEFGLKGKELKAIKLIGKNIGVCPEWHKGAGNKAWIFADEVVVE